MPPYPFRFSISRSAGFYPAKLTLRKVFLHDPRPFVKPSKGLKGKLNKYDILHLIY